MDREGTGVGAARHVLLLPGLCVAGQQHARRAVGEEDRYRVVVGLGEELAGRLSDNVCICPDGALKPMVKMYPARGLLY
jgi:hypothetical protein